MGPLEELLLVLCVLCRATSGASVLIISGEKGGQATLPCSTVAENAKPVIWFIGNLKQEVLNCSNETSSNPKYSRLNGSSLVIKDLLMDDEGLYGCKDCSEMADTPAQIQLKISNPPAFPMKCSAQYTAVPSGLALTCSWLGGYPSPLLQWENGNNVLSNGTSDTLEVTVNGSQYPNGQKLVCKGKHSIANIMKEEKCEVQLRYPMPQTEALRTCFKGENVTLSCTALEATPPAVITWLRNLSTPNVLIKPGPRYHITESGLISYLTIVNCSKEEDEGSYICMTENGVATKDIYIYLDITTPHNIIGLVSAILILLLIVIAIIIGTVLYCDPQFYMKAIALRKRESEVLVLVESEEEEEMQEVGDSVANTQSTIAEISSPAAVNGNVYKHEVLFHSPPDNLNSDLLDELPEETNGENLVEGL
ncbi:V-set and immunoglobulin domain-containing protein 10 isoform X2 [Dendrobates tinctorius]|uniref:V-set and immunoglobulin domain-containing protein 10 isoform X2 n=1 Tax=Dendrobates tinctorius TaxID=92724 RepID=UPI003CC9EF9C